MKIALTAPLRAGKSLAASYISLHYDFQPFAFGDELKDAFHRAFPHVPRNPKPRAHYQKFGQWAREAFGEDVWIDALMPKIAAYLERHPCDCGSTALKNRVIIDDCRQPNEYKRLKDEGFVFVRITAPAELRIERAKKAGDQFDLADLEHPTELAVNSFEVNYEIDNAGKPEELYEKLDAIMAEVLK
ncbi:dephospho-CoA kinase [Bacillus haynesii]|uniref:dephospho-CoA kinase n=1 Tax=Bacillus haynesii TaxID=1925021 RepID=UPI002280A56A|nr:dephospho-CoA kinase [Bacillus haynesii]MCY9372687.1 dephospho-CoA kinase [Bacillus haynesii]MEC0719014.1 dephospho-CoA kinase [Bacillus haynesii]